MKKHFSQKQLGFTLAETVITVAIFSGLAVSITLLLKDVYVHARQQQLALSNVDQARAVTAKFVNEIRNVTTGIDGSYPLNQAGDSQIIFFTTYGGNGTTVYRVRYYLSGTTLYKGVITPTGVPLAYVAANEVVTPVQNDVTNNTVPAFYYYDGDYNGSGTALSQPINVTTPKFVQINLLVLKEDKAGAGGTTFTVKDGALMRNLKTNLGN